MFVRTLKTAGILIVALVAVRPSGRPAVAQSPREVNPERPTVATHAYAVARGYAELEQGVRTFGLTELGEGTAWELNLKLGLARGVQLGVFGPLFNRTGDGSGIGDLGVSLKFAGALAKNAAIAVVPAVTFPTGDEARGLGAGQVLSSLVGVLSIDLTPTWHFDLNAGPVGVGAGAPQWFTSVGLAVQSPLGLATELFDFTSGGAGPRQRGLLAAAMLTLTEWALLDLGGIVGLTDETPDQLFIGLTTNVGGLF
jgi:hypothetical protein